MNLSNPIPSPPVNNVGTSPSGITFAKAETSASCAFSCAFDPQFHPVIDRLIAEEKEKSQTILNSASDWLYYHIELEEKELKLEWKTKENTPEEDREPIRQSFNQIIHKIIEL